MGIGSSGRSSDIVGPMILEALGLDPRGARKAVINLEAGRLIVIDVEYIARLDVDDLREITRRYTITATDRTHHDTNNNNR